MSFEVASFKATFTVRTTLYRCRCSELILFWARLLVKGVYSPGSIAVPNSAGPSILHFGRVPNVLDVFRV